MAGRAEFLFAQIKDRAAIDKLINESEDGHLDCKTWPANEKDAHGMLAKAVCGLANSDGGILVIGMETKQQKPGDPDVITGIAPVSDTTQVESRILTLIGNLVEPGIAGIHTREIGEKAGSKSGFVVVLVPKSLGPPHRSRKDSKFYIRVGSITLPMEYWQIEDRFGSRPHPNLELYLDALPPGYDEYRRPTRYINLGLTNTGAGIAKFPAVLFDRTLGLTVDLGGIDGNFRHGIPLRPSQSGRIIFGGGVDDVVYPRTTVMITKLKQSGQDVGILGIPITIQPIRNNRHIKARHVFNELNFKCEIACEGCETKTEEQPVAEADFIIDI